MLDLLDLLCQSRYQLFLCPQLLPEGWYLVQNRLSDTLDHTRNISIIYKVPQRGAGVRGLHFCLSLFINQQPVGRLHYFQLFRPTYFLHSILLWGYD